MISLSRIQTELNLLGRRLVLRLRGMNEKRLLILLSITTGALSACAALALKITIRFIEHEVVGSISHLGSSLLYLTYPALGIWITYLFVKYYVRDNISHGVTRVLYAISQKNSRLKRHNTYTSILASAITIGFGGSVGAEAPMVLTGSALGSNLGQWLKLNYKTITVLLGAGAAGAIAAIFNAPLAGLIFTIEVLMIDLTLSSIVPLLVSAVTATSISYLVMGDRMLFVSAIEPFSVQNLPYYIILGICCAFGAIYFTRATLWIESLFSKSKHPSRRLMVGGVMLGVLIFLFPPLYGEGYGVISGLLNNDSSVLMQNSLYGSFQENQWFILLILALIFLLKVVAMACTNGAGGVGGTFGPTLFVGGIMGAFVAKFINTMFLTHIPTQNFTLVGMAGMMSAVMQAPLTAIFLIAEISGGYALFLPLMLTATVAFITVGYFEQYSIYTKRLAMRGELLTHNKDQAVLTLLRTEDVIEKDFSTVNENASLGTLVQLVAESKRNVFPVLDEQKRLLGMVLLDDIRAVMFDQSLYETTYARDYMSPPPDRVRLNEKMDMVLRKFEHTGAWNLPVVSEKGEYIGFLSKSKIFSAYRDMLTQKVNH